MTKDAQGEALEVGSRVITVQTVTIPNKGSIPEGIALTVTAFGRSPNYVEVSYEGTSWYLDGAALKKV